MMFFWKRRKERPEQKKSGLLVVRKYHPHDLPEMKRITRAAFQGVSVEEDIEEIFGRLAGTTWQERRSTHIERDVTYWADFTFVAELNGEVVGFVTTATDRMSRVGHIRNLAVTPEHQHAGIGRSLIEHAVEFFRQSGMQYARIETLAQNERAANLYSKLGFREVGRDILFFRKLD